MVGCRMRLVFFFELARTIMITIAYMAGMRKLRGCSWEKKLGEALSD